jgi:hypothetical protein
MILICNLNDGGKGGEKNPSHRQILTNTPPRGKKTWLQHRYSLDLLQISLPQTINLVGIGKIWYLTGCVDVNNALKLAYFMH